MRLITGDCLAVMPTMEPNSVDAIVTDPPYGLGFMGKDWDHGVPGIPFWEAALRVAKPGAMLLAFGGTRTFHRLAVAIEDAGWEIRDTIMWVYGSGFPKSHDVSKAIDRAAGAVREVVGAYETRSIYDGCERTPKDGKSINCYGDYEGTVRPITAPATPAAAQWAGWGTALKPAWEPIIVARKPLQGTVAQNVLTWGTGAINVAACRVEFQNEEDRESHQPGFYKAGNNGKHTRRNKVFGADNRPVVYHPPIGRWPANVVHDGSDEVLAGFPVTTSGTLAMHHRRTGGVPPIGTFAIRDRTGEKEFIGDTGSAARFFYCAKASQADRDEGLEAMLEVKCGMMEDDAYPIKTGSGNLRDTKRRNHHPTVKPTALMRYLVRLVTPPGGVVLDPFMGSGSTGKAAVLEGFGFIGIDTNPEYVEIARRRIAAVELPIFSESGGQYELLA